MLLHLCNSASCFHLYLLPQAHELEVLTAHWYDDDLNKLFDAR